MIWPKDKKYRAVRKFRAALSYPCIDAHMHGAFLHFFGMLPHFIRKLTHVFPIGQQEKPCRQARPSDDDDKPNDRFSVMLFLNSLKNHTAGHDFVKSLYTVLRKDTYTMKS